MTFRGVWVGLGIVSAVIAGVLLWASDDVTEDSRALPAPGQGQEFKASYGHPDEFIRYHSEIRSAEDGSAYPHNYRMEEFHKAIALRKTPGVPIGWVERGPSNAGGRTRALVVAPDDPSGNTWYAGGTSGGLWVTTDSGSSWENLTDHLPNLAVTALAIPKTNPAVIYMGTGEGFGNADGVSGSGIFKSEDKGISWVQLDATAKDGAYRWVNRLAVDPQNADVLVAATNTGIYRTSDGGLTWSQVYATPDVNRVQGLQANPTDFQTQYAGVNSTAVVKSTDGGQSWSVVLDKFVTTTRRMELAIAPSNPDVVYASAEGGVVSSLYRSRDAGKSWNPILEINNNNWFSTQGWYNQAIAVNPFNENELLMGGVSLWVSRVGASASSVRYISELQEIGTENFLSLVSFDNANYLGGRLLTGDGDPQVANYSPVSREDYRTVEIRFGPGITQKAHRYTVSPRDGINRNGGAGIPLAVYRYGSYVDVPFEVWDVDNNRQLTASFRDQADDGEFNLIWRNESAGSRDALSREYLVVHDLPYDARGPHDHMARNGGIRWNMMYFIWPFLPPEAEWDAAALPESRLRIVAEDISTFNHFVQAHPQNHAIHVDHHSLQMIPVDEAAQSYRVIGTNDGGIAYSQNSGETFSHVGRGYNTTQFYGVAKRPGFDIYFGGTQDNASWLSSNRPTSQSAWQQRICCDGFDAVWHAEDHLYVLGSSQNNGIWKSDNGGRTFRVAGSGHPDSRNGVQFYTVFGYSPASPDRVFTVSPKGVWVSNDFGQRWERVEVDMDLWITSGRGSGKVEVSRANPDVVWAGYRLDDTPPIRGIIHVSTDGGKTFRPTKVPDFAPEVYVSGIATHPTDDRVAYVLFSAYGNPKVLRTADYGETWVDLSGFAEGASESSNGFPNVAVYDMLVMPGDASHYWVGTEIGLFESTDAGRSWHYSANGLPAVSIAQMLVQDDQIVLATHGRGVWTVDLAEAVSVKSTPELPLSVRLSQNYPNPFVTTTTIGFDLPAPSQVRVRVFDVAGREVVTLADARFPAGSHSLDWEAAGHASGLYHYRLETDTGMRSRTMMLVK